MFEAEKAVVAKWLGTLHTGAEGAAAGARLLHPKMSWTLIGSTPISGTHRGLEEIGVAFQHKCWNGDGRGGSGPQGLDPDYGIRPLAIDDLVALEDGRVLVRCRSDGRGKNGLAYRNEYCWIITVQDNRIAKLHEFADTALIERVMFDKRIVPAETLSAPNPA